MKKQNAEACFAIFRGEGDLNYFKEKLRLKKQLGVKYYSLEDVCYPSSDGGKKGELFEIFGLIADDKPLCASLCWNGENAFASGCRAVGGIKPAGERFVRTMNEMRIPLDLAHINEQGFYRGVELSYKPLCTHSALDFVFPHARNLKKEQIETLLRAGGVFGIIGVRHFLCSATENAKNAFYRHIDAYLQNFGVKGLCVGSDFFGSDAPVFCDGDYSFLPSFEEKLLNMGVKKSDVEKIEYANAAEFFGF